MLRWAITFFILALIAGALGFWGLSGTAMDIAKFLAIVFLVLFVIALIAGRAPVSGPPV
ncbi:MAG: DUF1328 domain-containing protein [Isosphaeraceae bacterium]|nr:DUF1328 domain-containing protein [Isosphaeraceae bacterium]